MGAKYRLQDVSQLNGRNIFFDANVLIYLFWPTGLPSFEQNYARVFRNLLRQGNNLFVDFLVTSEVINRILRNEHQRINPSQKLKDFRNSEDVKDALDDIYIIVKNDILARFNVVGNILQRFHDYLTKQAPNLPPEEEQQRGIYRLWLERAYQDFVTSDSLTEKVFAVFQHVAKPDGRMSSFVSLDKVFGQ